MQSHSKSTSAIRADVPPAPSAALAGLPPRAIFRTVKQFAARNPAFTPSALRNLIFKAEARLSSRGEIPGNGLAECGAILRIGRKVLIDEHRFFGWVRRQNDTARSTAGMAPCVTFESNAQQRSRHHRVCEVCNGAGADPSTSDQCQRCAGAGWEPGAE